MPAARTTLPPKPSRRKRGFEPASKLVAGQLRGPLEKRGFSEAKLITHWREIVGADIADAALPVKIRHARGDSIGATLVLLTTGGHAPLLDMQKDAIRQRVNACYGYNAVSRVQITQTAPTGFAEGQVAFVPRAQTKPQPTPQIIAEAEAAAAPIRDQALKEALERLARNVLTKNSH